MHHLATKKSSGFTLIEVLLVVLVLAILGGIASRTLGNFYSRSGTDVAERELRASLRKAQLYSLTSRQASGWGLYYDANLHLAKLFCLCPGVNAGTSYATRDTAYDEKISFPKSISITGFSGQSLEIRFAKVNGIATVVPTMSFPVTITINGPTGGTRTLSIYNEGTITGY